MQDVMQAIQTMCLTYPYQEKYLVIPSYRMKRQIQKYLNDQGLQTVNLKIVSAGSIAMEWAEEEVLRMGAKILSYNDVADLMGEVLANLKSQNKLQFLRDTMITPGLNRTISSGILELKMNGIRQGKVQLSAITNAGKRNDLEQIFAAYEALLKEKNYLDHGDLLEIAIRKLMQVDVKNAACFVLPGCRFSYQEQQLLARLLPEGQPLPSHQEEALDLDFSGKPWNFVRAYGVYNEVKEVIRQVIRNQIPLDSVLVAVTTEEPYAQLFYQMLQSYLPLSGTDPSGSGIFNVRTQVPMTFGTGLPVTFSNPGKLALALLKWIKSGYQAHDLISIFSSGSFNLASTEDDEPAWSRPTIIRIIKDANLKWQRQTYRKTLAAHRTYLERKVEESITVPDRQIAYQERLDTLLWLDQVLEQDLFANLPEVDQDGKVDADQLYRGVARIIQKYKRLLDPLDVGGYDAVLGELNGSLKTDPVLVSEAVDLVVDRIKQVRTFVNDPAPGKIHLTSYRTASWVNREHVFLLGMDSGRFPGVAMEDPFLLDEERTLVSPNWLITSEEKLEDKIREMKRFLTAVSGKLTMSYPYFDTVDQREQYPSAWYLEALDAGKEAGIAQQVLERTVGFATADPLDCIDEKDAWLQIAMGQGAIGTAESAARLRETHPKIAWLNDRMSQDSLGNGRVRVLDPATVDPRVSGRVQSASTLAEYLNCRYKYLLKHVMNLKEFKEKEFDTIGWLDPLESGSLFHHVLEEYHNRAMQDPRLRQDKELAVDTIQGIAADTIRQYEEDLPTGSAFYTEMKKEDILLDCRIYAEEDVENHHRYEPILTEYRFGFEGDLILPLGSGESIRVMGAVDRIDQLGNGAGLRIVDYKTGGTSSYRVLDEVDAPPLNHKSLQPALYYLALQELAKTDTELAGLGPVKQAVYHFVNRKGDYEQKEIWFSAGMDPYYRDGLSSMFQDMAEGNFIQSELEYKPGSKKSGYSAFVDSYLCKYCGYREICLQSLLSGHSLEALEDAEEEGGGDAGGSSTSEATSEGVKE